MNFIHEQQDTIFITEIFNEQHGNAIFELKLQLKPKFNKIIFQNVGIKLMKDALEKFIQQQIINIELNYNWNMIMMMPKLVCYDKNQWKTLQQLTNWNRQWSLLFQNCLYLQNITIKFICSWMDEEFIKIFLKSISQLPNIKFVYISIQSRNLAVKDVLQAYQQAKIFSQYQYTFKKYELI